MVSQARPQRFLAPALLLALLMLLAQGVAVAHAADHGDEPVTHDCGVCVHGQSLDAGLCSTVAAERVSKPDIAMRSVPVLRGPEQASPRRYVIRGPPSHA